MHWLHERVVEYAAPGARRAAVPDVAANRSRRGPACRHCTATSRGHEFAAGAECVQSPRSCARPSCCTALRSEREVVLEAVVLHERALEYAARELRAEREVALEAVRQHERDSEHALSELRAEPIARSCSRP